MYKLRKKFIKLLSLLGAVCFTLSFSVSAYANGYKADGDLSVENVKKLHTPLDTGRENFFDPNVVYKVPQTVASEEVISVIVTMSTETVMDAYQKSATEKTLSEYAVTKEAEKVADKIVRESDSLMSLLRAAGVDFTVGERYDTILSGFEINIKAKDFSSVGKVLGEKANLILGDVYEPAETQIVTNEVDVYETGIFDSSKSTFQGDGVVVAVLDTGLDYTHTAFSTSNFYTSQEAFTLESVSEKVGQTTAASFTSGLTGEDVYLNKKVPYAYDYADKDADVLPINSEHGTHVAGIIAGKDDRITGVAPNAQLAIMKVFSDETDGAKSSWLIAALEDCVTLGVDVINMSLGSSCGFTRETDEVQINDIYDKVKNAGISLITAASNDYNATFGSDKNGSNGLTSNPDSGTVGSPSTYEGSLSVASVDGVKTPYMLYNDRIIYFTEAATSSAKTKHFVDDILNAGENSRDFEYVTIPGVGRSSDYPETGNFYNGKIVLVKRGDTTFEDKIRVALREKGAAGIIIYNNVSGTISMSVGANIGAACSISQDEGELLAAAGSGIIRISRDQVAGPFMSDFSSWGPTSDLKIKPEITAHGGEILSAVPGQDYDRLSGTSMAAPNQAGATALIRQYVKYSGVFDTYIKDDADGNKQDPKKVTAIVNQLMMSSADIVYNKNGLPYAVRKQGAGLVNIGSATTAEAYLTTYNGDIAMEKTKVELGDDKNKTGVYEFSFDINNTSGKTLTYDIGSIIQTEGVSTTYTGHGDTTVTQDGRLLDASTTVVSVSGGTQNGNTVTVSEKTAKVTVKIVLSDADKEYLNKSFKHGMYVEGFVTLTAKSGTKVNLNTPVLAFFGDWTEAPIFDEEYYDTNPDELNMGLDPDDKIMADAYATRAIGGLYSDYISTLGSYYFIQNPASTPIAADKNHISLSNVKDGENSSVNSINSIWAGLLRNVKTAEISIVDDSTGKEIFFIPKHDIRKSYSRGTTISGANIEVEFDALAHNLKNNTKYTVTVTTYIDYGRNEDQKNVRNVFEFPLYIDFEAPVITDVEFRTEYDITSKQTKLFADFNVYDNHYAMGLQLGQVTRSGSELTMSSFGRYITPVYSSFNSTSKVTIELTDYVAQMKKSVGVTPDGLLQTNSNSFVAVCYDYALNSATYEINLPDDIMAMYFENETVTMSPNEVMDMSQMLKVYPTENWMQTLDFEVTDIEGENVISVVNQTIVAKNSGLAKVTAVGHDGNGKTVTAELNVKVLAKGEDGFREISIPQVNKFSLTGYTTLKAFYNVTTSEREIGVTDGEYALSDTAGLSMYPSESVKISYSLDAYFPDRTKVVFRSGNSRVATVTEDGVVVAQARGTTRISADVLFDGGTTHYTRNVSITVKEPFITNSIYLTSYRGLGGTVTIPDDKGLTTISAYAFSNYDYVPKDLDKGDVIDKEDPYNMKIMYIGEDTITRIIIPEGITTIEEYAFANLTKLEEVVLPSTLTRIGVGAFLGCEKLKKINLQYAKFINAEAFAECALQNVDLDSVNAIGNYAFRNCPLGHVELPASSQSLGEGAFYNNGSLTNVSFAAPKVKIGPKAFENCENLNNVEINAAVISSYAFNGCKNLTEITLGRDVAVIGEFAFAGTAISRFKVDGKNPFIKAENNGALLLKKDAAAGETVLFMVAPASQVSSFTTNATAIETGAFSGNPKLLSITANNVKRVAPYAFANCTNLETVTMNRVEEIGDSAFINTKIVATPNLDNVKTIGNSAFRNTYITSVIVPEGAEIGAYAFAYNGRLQKVTIRDGVTIGRFAFYNPITDYSGRGISYYTRYEYAVKDTDGKTVKNYAYYRYNTSAGVSSSLSGLEIGEGVKIGNYAFAGNGVLKAATLGDGAEIGDYAFFNCGALEDIELSAVTKIGAYAFSGTTSQDLVSASGEYEPAYDLIYIDGKEVANGYVYSSFAPRIKSIDLSSATEIGYGAFAGNTALSSVTLGDNLKEIASELFADCGALTAITLPGNVTKIGDNAFAGTSLASVNLDNIEKIGEYAFGKTALTEVTLKYGAEIADSAFALCFKLGTVNNIKNVYKIGAEAFAYTALPEADLSGVSYVGDFAFANSAVTEVTLGEKLVSFGENPFYNCEIVTFGKIVEEEFGGCVIGETLSENYDASANVKVIDGVLYQVVENGLELVSYPLLKETVEYIVEENTARISARAFAGNKAIKNVTIASTVKAIGDKAFYGCDNLSVVVFKGYEAPVLEEEYDLSYATDENNRPFVLTEDSEKIGLPITKYFMWNTQDAYSIIYYGANFKDYIGHIENKLVMIKPVNGRNYDTFIFGAYFDKVILGNAAIMDETKAVINLINALPRSVTLDDEAQIVAARNAYEAISSLEQKALIDNYSLLTSAESTLAYLKLRNEQPVEPESPAKEISGFAKFMRNNMVGLIIAFVAIAGFVTYIVLDKTVFNKKAKETNETKEEKADTEE